MCWCFSFFLNKFYSSIVSSFWLCLSPKNPGNLQGFKHILKIYELWNPSSKSWKSMIFEIPPWTSWNLLGFKILPQNLWNLLGFKTPFSKSWHLMEFKALFSSWKSFKPFLEILELFWKFDWLHIVFILCVCICCNCYMYTINVFECNVLVNVTFQFHVRILKKRTLRSRRWQTTCGARRRKK